MKKDFVINHGPVGLICKEKEYQNHCYLSSRPPEESTISLSKQGGLHTLVWSIPIGVKIVLIKAVFFHWVVSIRITSSVHV